MKRNYSQFFAICKKEGFEYKEVIKIYTGDDRQTSLSSLSDKDYEGMMTWLKKLNEPSRLNYEPKEGDQIRKKMLSICSKMHPTENTMQLLNRLDNWCLKQKFKKPLMKHNKSELALLVTIYEERVYADYLIGYNR